jgi:succinate dehydrogenase / fumarate reductase, cytochrome b subunit
MYKGREGQWAFFLHRLSGLALLLYLLLHTVSIGSVMLGEQAYNTIHRLYENIFFRFGLIGVAGAVAYHAFNGLRIIAMDFTAWGVKYQRQMWYVVLVLAIAATAVALVYNLPRMFDDDPKTQVPVPQHLVALLHSQHAGGDS